MEGTLGFEAQIQLRRINAGARSHALPTFFFALLQGRDLNNLSGEHLEPVLGAPGLVLGTCTALGAPELAWGPLSRSASL